MVHHHLLQYMLATLQGWVYQISQEVMLAQGKAENLKLQTLTIMHTI